VKYRNAEDGHYGIADELLDGSTVGLDDPADPLEVTDEDCAESLGIERLAERRRPRHVAEEHRHRLAQLPHRHRGSELRPAVGTKGEVALDLTSTSRADRHLSSVVRLG
jgi:hypothetical protein